MIFGRSLLVTSFPERFIDGKLKHSKGVCENSIHISLVPKIDFEAHIMNCRLLDTTDRIYGAKLQVRFTSKPVLCLR